MRATVRKWGNSLALRIPSATHAAKLPATATAQILATARALLR